MRVTVCQWPDAQGDVERAWEDLVAHACARQSELIVLPEMPFSAWLAASQGFDPARWQAAVDSYRAWEERFPEAGAAIVGTRPYTFGNERLSAAFLWEAETGTRAAHAKSSVDNQEGAWEAVWYAAAPRDFTPALVGEVDVGFLIGMELRELGEAIRYAEEGVKLLITPRATTRAMREDWLKAGIAAASQACVFALSSNRADSSGRYGGDGWIISPRGDVLARTTVSEPLVTLDLDLTQAQPVRRNEPTKLPIMSSTSAT